MEYFPPSLQPGEVVAERYEVRRLIARFGVNDVHEAHDRHLERLVDLFSVRVPEAIAPNIEMSLRRDLALSKRVRHPNVWQLFSYEADPHGGVIVAEHLGGHTLHTVIRERHAKSGFSAIEFRTIATQLSSGLAAIHAAGIVHADIKPGRVQVDGWRVVLRMFEFARDDTDFDNDPMPFGGTPQYMAPERLRGMRPTMKADVYSLGLTLLEMWTCLIPNMGANAREKALLEQVRTDPTMALERWEIRQLFSMLHEDPTKRPAASELQWRENEMVGTPGTLDIEEERRFAHWIGEG